MSPSAVIFDFDGTIADTEWPVYEAARVAHEDHGLTLPIEEWVKIVGRADNQPLAERLRDLLDRDPDPEIMDRVKTQRDRESHAAPPLPGVHGVIDSSRAAGRPLGIASSSPMDWVGGHLERLGLFDRFTSFSTRDQVDRGKPAPDLFLLAASQLERDPADVLVIEDSRNGAIAAKAAGMSVVVVPNRITRHDIPREADLVLDSLLDFPFADFGLPEPG
ncbi:MAG: HAD-IA family hydrolase [Actinomycetota bacterium]